MGSARLPQLPQVESQNVRLAGIKPAERGKALILRLAEFRGLGGTAQVRLPAYVRAAARTNLLERQAEALEIEAGSIQLELRAWEIATLRLELE
jgi:alpha-mannosidase